MIKKLHLKTLLLIAALLVGSSSAWAETVTLTNANIVAAGDATEGYASWDLSDGNGNSWSAYAIKYKHSNATSSYHFLQIKKYASSTAYYIQVPTLGTKITSIKMTVSGASKPMDGGENSATLFFSASNSTSSTGTGVASGTGGSSVTIDCSSLNLNSGYITASASVRIWDVEVTYSLSSNTATSGDFTWDLSTNTYTIDETNGTVTWSDNHANMVNTGTNYKNYLGGDSNNRTSSRFYTGNTLTITPASGFGIASVEFTAASVNYASTLGNSTWTNATTAVDGTKVTVTPTNRAAAISATIGGTCGFTAVKVYWESIPASVTNSVTSAGLATFASDYSLDYSDVTVTVTGLEAYIAKEESGAITLTKVNKVPAGTGVLLRATAGGTSFNVPVTSATTDDVTGNLFVRGTGAAVSYGEGPYNYVLSIVNNKIGFYKANNNTVATNRAYLQTTIAAGARLEIDGMTGITGVNLNENQNENRYYDLQGCYVAQPTKGLYIVNGRKVVIK